MLPTQLELFPYENMKIIFLMNPTKYCCTLIFRLHDIYKLCYLNIYKRLNGSSNVMANIFYPTILHSYQSFSKVARTTISLR